MRPQKGSGIFTALVAPRPSARTLACAVTAGPVGALLFLGGRCFVFSLDSAFFHFCAFLFVLLVLILKIKLRGVWDCGT